MKNRRLGFVLIIIYVIMFIVCLYLNSGQSTEGVIINLSMFAIVAGLFIFALFCFSKVNSLKAALIKATRKIESDFNENPNKLWINKSAEYREVLFSNKTLCENYLEYSDEMVRLESSTNGRVSCDIEDYINRDTMDIAICKNMLNLIPGIMTGLGILGTFIGLSLGLQHFNTGSASEISDSIAPLMNGIKVAFHTSIYGMIFSLFFNWVYKRTLEDSYIVVEKFINTFNRCVVSDAENENVVQLQTVIADLPSLIGAEVANKVMESTEPFFTSITNSLDKFAENVSSNQIEAMQKLVDGFMSSMNQSLGENFQHLGETIEKTCEMQNRNNEFMEIFVQKMDSLSTNVIEIDTLSQKTVTNLAEYIENIEELQKIVNSNLTSMNIQMEQYGELQGRNQEYIDVLVGYEKSISEASDQFTKDMATNIEKFSEMENTLSNGVKENLNVLAEKATEFSDKLVEATTGKLNEISENMTGHIDKMVVLEDKMTEEMSGNMRLMFQQYTENLEAGKEHLDNLDKQVTVMVQENLNNLTQKSDEFSEKLVEATTNRFDAISDNMSEQIRTMSEAQREISEGVRESIEVLNERAEKYGESLIEVTDRHIGEMTEEAKMATEGMEKASAQLVNVTQDFSVKLSDSLHRTFQIFDENLSEITKHLSGTILEIDATLSRVEKTTDKVPRVVASAYSDLDDSFRSLQKNIDELVKIVKDAEKNI